MKIYDRKFIRNLDSINQQIKIADNFKKDGKSTQDESTFLGEYIPDRDFKVMKLGILLGPLGLIKPFLMSIKKNYNRNIKTKYYYCDISRMKLEKVLLNALLVSLFYALLIFYLVQKKDAERLDKLYKNNQITVSQLI